MQILGIGGDVQLEASTTKKDDWNCEILKTTWFTPTTEYIVKSLENTEVKKFLVDNQVWLRRSKVYMITGIKVAYGASSAAERAINIGVKLHLGVDATMATGVPVSGGPDIGAKWCSKTMQGSGRAEPFVFAFRLRQIKVSAKGDVAHKQLTSGAMLSLDSATGNEEAKIDLIIDGLESEDADADEFALDGWATVDDAAADETCGCSKAE
jgi:hypothetical protein